jgi:hypothetical protein
VDIRRDLICTLSERDKRITKFALIADGPVAQDVLLGNFVLRPGEEISRGTDYEVVIRPKGPSGRNGS